MRRHAIRLAQAQRELIELAAQDEKQRFGRLDRVLEIEGLRQTSPADAPVATRAAPGRGAFPERARFRPEPLDEFAARQAREFAEMADAPVVQHGDELRRRVDFGDARRPARKAPGCWTTSTGSARVAASAARSGFGADADRARNCRAAHRSTTRAPTASQSPALHLPQIERRRALRRGFDERRKRARRLEQQRRSAPAPARAHAATGAAPDTAPAPAWRPCRAARRARRGGGHLQHVAFFRAAFDDRDRLRPRLLAQAQRRLQRKLRKQNGGEPGHGSGGLRRAARRSAPGCAAAVENLHLEIGDTVRCRGRCSAASSQRPRRAIRTRAASTIGCGVSTTKAVPLLSTRR